MSDAAWDSDIDDNMLVTAASAPVLVQESNMQNLDNIFAPVFNNCSNITINFGVGPQK
jgi:hypothetical protein